MSNLLKKIISKILLKITILVIVEIILIVGSFSVLAYFQSQQSSLGNSINIAGKNRYLTANLLLQSEKYLYGLSSNTSQLKVAMNSLESNIIVLKQGGMISDIDLKPLPSNFLDLWNAVDVKWNVFKTYVTNKLLTPPQARTAMDQSLTRTVFESTASNLINSSDKLVTQLGQQTDKNSQNLILLQILFAILIVSVTVLILYLVARILRPIFVLTQATSKVEKGNLDVSVEQKGSDELSVLSRSFNSMTAFLRDYIKKQAELTRQLEVANEELERKDRLKDEFINIAAHELRGPIQPILGLAEILRYRKRGQGDSGNSSSLSKQDDDKLLDIIIRNAKRLLRLEQNILDIARIDSQSLKLEKERFDLIEKIQNVINDFGNGLSNEKIELVFTPSQKEPIFVNADKVRIFEVISNLLCNAVKFTKEGKVTINAEKQDTQVLVSIKDTGSGIQPELMSKLFSKYVTNSPLGTGVGLFISKGIIEAHGGKIWAENNANAKGATFTFRLPLEC
ncbi:MAG TPA: ATP-binding protein [Methylomirabilota bacterium]|nr:ATP-binding protein [Methylomirabilota bacterium]